MFKNYTFAPQDLSNCMAIFPTPPDPPRTSVFLLTAFEEYNPPATFKAPHTVKPAYNKPAASSSDM